MKRLTQAVAAAALSTALVGAGLSGTTERADAAAGANRGRHTYTGTIGGAEYKVETPERWNGTLLIYSHPYYPAGMPEFPPGHGNRVDSEEWLLEQGYALAASDFKGRTGFVVKEAVRDQVGVLDWFEDHVGKPRRTVATGSSGGGAISLLLAEKYPHRIDGVLAMCTPIDLYGQMNLSLDINFALKTLLDAKEVELVNAKDPAASVQRLQEVMTEKVETAQGRARIALAGAFGNVTGWNSAHDPKPATIEGQARALYEIQLYGAVGVFGAVGQADLAEHAGGNPSYNVGVDYARQLAKSNQLAFVRKAYREAGLDLGKDLARLAAAPRISPDPQARQWMLRHAVPRGTTPSPVVTLHNTVDLAVPDHERWYATQVRRHGNPTDLRQLFVARATHCAFTVAEEAVALQTLLNRINTGHWPTTDPAGLNVRAAALGERWSKVFDFATGGDAVRAPGFTKYRPAPLLRSSR
ncbi:alpha/beta hydrolase family protein [Kribbella sp. NPDC051620]|uniref:alpha/beta hydrolase family protein n=1 Tax=Kribbella sp. NPDC051620 TaxID=3364120 RepID=UPI00379D85A7